MQSGNIFGNIPDNIEEEAFERLVQSSQVTIERIISRGHTSPETGWYDQAQNEWVLVLKGNARIAFDDGVVVELNEGDYVNIPAGKKHKVVGTSLVTETLWLAVFY